MRVTRRLTVVPPILALSALLAVAGCFTELKRPRPKDADVTPSEASVPGPDAQADQAAPSIDGWNDVPVASTGGVIGSAGGSAGRPSDGPVGSGGFAGAVGSGGVAGLGGGAGASGGGAGLGGGAGGGTVTDAPVDQKTPGPVGSACATASDCALGNCIDGVCCATACADCNACANALTGKADGTCAPVLTGRDPHEACADETASNECGNDGTCDGAGACRKVSTSHVCEPGTCTGNAYTPASTCDGRGACTIPTPEDCGSFQCAAATGCLKSCTSQTDCSTTSYCKITSGTTGTCTAKNPNGTPATQGFECTSGIVADGVCCNKACTGCSACSGAPLTGAPAGTCSFVLDGQIAHNACTASGVTCGLDGKCDGAGACRSTPKQGESCNDPANKCVTGRVCQSGACTAGTTTTCPPSTLQCRGAGTCDPATGSCAYPWALDGASCTDNNSCTNDVCQGGSCVSTQIPCNNPPACKQSTTCSGGTCSYTQSVADGTVDYKCPSEKQFCVGGQCAQCISDAQCTSVRRSCDPSTHQCVCMKPSSGNLLKNPGFDGSLANWTAGIYSSYSTIDSDGCPESGSVYINGSSDSDPYQCIPDVKPGKQYYVGLRSRGGNPGGMIRIYYFTGAGCTGTQTSTDDPFHFPTPPDNTTWVSLSGGFTPPSDTASARFAVWAWDQWLDQMYVNPDGQWF